MLVSAFSIVGEGALVAEEFASAITVLPSSETSAGASASAVISVHTCVSVRIAVLEGKPVVESGAVSEIVATIEVELVLAAASGFGCTSVWPSSFSGVLHPGVVVGGAGLIIGFGRRGGFPADSCADTLDRS